MGIYCTTIKKKPLEETTILNCPPQVQRCDQLPTLTQFSQNLEDISSYLRKSTYKIPVLKQDIRTIYKFEKTIGDYYFLLKFF